MTGTPGIPAGLRTAMWGLGVAVLGMGTALVATIDLLKRERQAGEHVQATVQALRDSLRAVARGPRSTAAGALDGARGRIEGWFALARDA